MRRRPTEMRSTIAAASGAAPAVIAHAARSMSATGGSTAWRAHQASSVRVSASPSATSAASSAATRSASARRPAGTGSPARSSPPARHVQRASTPGAQAENGREPIPWAASAAATRGWCAVKNPPPSSTRSSVPGSGAVQVRPPSRSRASSSVTAAPAVASSRAADRPANPPPRMIASRSVLRIGALCRARSRPVGATAYVLPPNRTKRQQRRICMSDYAVINPATGESVKEYPTISDDDLRAAIGRVDAAHREWSSSTTVEERAALIRRVAELHNEHRQRLGEIIVREMGKPIEQAVGEVEFCVAIYEFYADNGPKLLADEPIDLLDGEGSAFVRRSSFGLLLGIMPWNYPYYQVARFAGPNLVDRQHDPAQARAAVPGVGRGDRADLPRRRVPEGRLHQHLRDERADRVGHRRPAGPRRVADRLRARGRGRRRDRRAQPQEGRARARRLGPVHRARHRRPRRGGRVGGRRRGWRTPARRATPPSASSSSTSSTSRSSRSSPPR